MDIGIIIIVVSIIILLVLREVYLWYWKINYRIQLQEKQNDLLSKIYESLQNKTSPCEKESAQNNYVSSSEKYTKTEDVKDSKTEVELMAQYGIIKQDDKYIYKGKLYKSFKDVIDYARFD